MLSLPVVAILLSVLSGPVPTMDVPTPPPSGNIVIDVVTVNGSGCPPGSAAVAVALDNSAFEVTYAFPAPPPTTPPDMRKNCQLSLVVHAPRGYTYAVQAADHRGFARLSTGSSAVHRSTFYLSGGPTPSSFIHSLVGPLNDDWQAIDTVDPASVVYAPCGQLRNFNLTNEIRLSAGGSRPPATDLVTLDTTTYHLLWQRCPTTSAPLGAQTPR